MEFISKKETKIIFKKNLFNIDKDHILKQIVSSKIIKI